MGIAIKVEGLSKAYQLGQIGTGTISRDLERWVAKMRGKEDPFLKIGETNDRTVASKSNVVWSLKDIDFEIKQGDAVGIIGRNGAGKSTLLKLLSRVTSPTTGIIKANGRIASLLEVGTGFHPELTGRENIYLNGAILGMRKKEIDRKFDEIVDFSGVERYVDTPVKRYSSGMYVRLAFAVAANLDSEILIVDEVLAVGDAEFQKRCLGKMNDLSKGEGRTVLFVSHNMGVINKLCTSAILLKNGKLDFLGSVSDAISKYLEGGQNNEGAYTADINTNKECFIASVIVMNAEKELTDNFLCSESVFIKTTLIVNSYDPAMKISVTLQNAAGDFLSTLVEDISDYISAEGKFTITIQLPPNVIAPNSYALRFATFVTLGVVYDLIDMVCPFKIYDSGSKLASFEGNNYGWFNMDYKVLNNK
ncbi:MAG TPA: polysaccharide ABC transporter ATP-binding protein [Ferruginibacter sp.]|jgi:lipopolysaccharide transport system ATP-binding protein|nr:polysaccharide ABC transporter ATP-binding protein [Ferruginibacter sp.]